MSTADGPIDSFTLGMMLIALGLVLVGLFCALFLVHELVQRRRSQRAAREERLAKISRRYQRHLEENP